MAAVKKGIEEVASCSSHVPEVECKRRKIDSECEEQVETEAPDNGTEDSEMPAADSTSESPAQSDDEEEDPEVASIVDSVTQQQLDEFKPFHERYFVKKYCTKFTKDNVNLDTCIRVHTNRIYVVYLSENHSIIKNHQRIKYINFQVSKKVNRLKNTLSGKGKRGGQMLQPESVLCFMETEDGIQYAVHAGVNGKLLEINSRLAKNPNMLIDDLNEGFLAIILPDLRKHEDNVKALMTSEEYNT